MRILFLAIGNRLVASSRVRVYSYVPYLRKEGFKVFLMHYTPSWQCRKILAAQSQGICGKAISKAYSAVIILILFILAPFFDIVVVQKVALSPVTVFGLKMLNKNIIFEFDDAIFRYQDITYILKKASCVIVSNRYLMDFAKRHNKRVYELPSPVEVNRRFVHNDNSHIIIGWIGSPRTAEYLKPLVPVFRALKGKFKNLIIEIVGVEKDTIFKPHLDVKTARWSVDNGQRHFERADVGIMPLPDDDWARGKAGYKLLQYMSAGIPCVASPVGINKEIIKNGVNGFLADTQQDWQEKLSLLIEDNALRRRMGQEGRTLVERVYSYKVNVSRLAEILGEINVG